MKSVLFQSGQRIIKQILEWLQIGKESNDVERRQDFSDEGILVGLLNEFDIIEGTNNTPSTPSITVRTGVAYDANGERIIIDDENISYDATNPSDTTDDGLGNSVSTPKSTGSKNVSLTPNSNNFIWISYLQTIDNTVFTLQKITNAKQFYKQTDGYEIIVTTTDSPPTLSSLKLGNVDLTGGGVVSSSTISKSGRVFSRLKLNRVKVKNVQSNKSDRTQTYGFDQELFLDDHIKAVGTGVISATNPHGLSVDDLGFDPEATLEQHQQFLHTTGIIGDRTSTTSSLYLEHVPVSPGEDFVKIKPLTSSEVAHINGRIIDSADIPAEVSLLFSSSVDGTGTYYVFIDKSIKQVQRSSLNPSSDPNKILLWSFTWTADPGGSPMDGNISSIVDHRFFETTTTPLEGVDGTASNPTYSFNSDPNTGIYLQGPDTLSITAGGSESARFATTGFQTVDGTAANPSLAFTSDPDTGLYSVAADQLGIAIGGNARHRFDEFQLLTSSNSSISTPSLANLDDPDTGLLWLTGALNFVVDGAQAANFSGSQAQFLDGTSAAPGISFLSDPNIGMRRSNPGELTFSTGGFANPVVFQNSGQAVFNVGIEEVRTQDGSTSDPKFTFQSDQNTGLYRVSSDRLGVTCGGVQAANFSQTDLSLFSSGKRLIKYAGAIGVGSLPSGTLLTTITKGTGPSHLYAVATSGTDYQSLREYIGLHKQSSGSWLTQIHETHAGFDDINRADIFLEETASSGVYNVKVSQFTSGSHRWAVYGYETI